MSEGKVKSESVEPTEQLPKPSPEDSDWKRIFLICLSKYPWISAVWTDVMLAPIADAMEAYADMVSKPLREKLSILGDNYMATVSFYEQAQGEVVRLRARIAELERAAKNLLEHDGGPGSRDYSAPKICEARKGLVKLLGSGPSGAELTR